MADDDLAVAGCDSCGVRLREFQISYENGDVSDYCLAEDCVEAAVCDLYGALESAKDAAHLVTEAAKVSALVAVVEGVTGRG